MILRPLSKEDQIGDWKLIADVAEGSGAHVYKAQNLSGGRVCALKVMLDRCALESPFDRALQQFRAEGELAKRAAELNPRRFPEIYEIIKDTRAQVAEVAAVWFDIERQIPGTWGFSSCTVEVDSKGALLNPIEREAIAMEFVGKGSCRDLSDYLKIQKRLHPFSAVFIAVQILDGLRTLDDAGIINRDLKSENILINTENLRIKITDFGFAGIPAGRICGTPEYSSPESFMLGDVSRRSDLYSLGVILYAMLVGQRPFWAPSKQGIIYKHRSQPPPEMPSHVPPLLRDVTMKLLEKNPSDRYQHAREVAVILTKWAISQKPELRDTDPYCLFVEEAEAASVQLTEAMFEAIRGVIT